MMAQATLGDYLAEQGMGRADAHADADWRARVDEAILHLARSGENFTAEEVRKIAGDPPAGTSPNAMGARMRMAARRGWIRRIGFVPATRPTLHVHHIGLWVGTREAA